MKRFVVALLGLSLVAGPVLAADTAGTPPPASQEASKGAKAATPKKHHGHRHHSAAKPAPKEATAK